MPERGAGAMKIPAKLTRLMLLGACAACSALCQASAGVGDVTVYLLQNEQLLNQYTACVQVGVAEQKGYVPGVRMIATFENVVSSRIEVNGRAVQGMPNSTDQSQ